MNSFFTGLLFLTRLPIKYNANWTEEACGNSVKYFTIIGLILGIINSLCAYIIFSLLPHFLHITITVPLASFFLLLISIILTGAIHYDGYTDTMDGLLSGRKKDRILEIMKDSRVGAHGATSLIMLILGKYAAIFSLCSSTNYTILYTALLFAPVLGRLGLVIGVTLFPYARKEGLGKAFSTYSNKFSLILNIIITLICLSINLPKLSTSIIAFIVVIIFTLIFGHYITKKLGGLTGDVYGATSELSEFLVLFIFTIC